MRYLFVLLLLLQMSCSNTDAVNTAKLGDKQFSSDTWLSSSQEDRAEMINSFFQQYDVKGMDAREIFELLGESTAYYDYDEIPAYVIGSKSIESVYGEGYVLAFPIDSNTGKIRKFIIEPGLDEN